MRVRWTALVLIAAAVIGFGLSPGLTSWVIVQRAAYAIEKIHTFRAEIVATEWSNGEFTGLSAELVYGGPACWSLHISEQPVRNSKYWVRNQDGLWCYSEAASAATWMGNRQDVGDDLALWFLPYSPDWLSGDLQFAGTVSHLGRRHVLLVNQQGTRLCRYYIDSQDFLLKRYEEVSPNSAKVYSWHNVRINCSVSDAAVGLAIPASVPLISIYDLQHPFQDGAVAVPYDLKRLQELQQACTNGYQTWRLDPVQVAMAFITAHFPELADELTIEDLKLQDTLGPPAVVVVENGGHLRKLYLEQLIQQGAGGIWTVTAYQYTR